MQRLQQIRDLILLRLNREGNALQIQQPLPRILVASLARRLELRREVFQLLHRLLRLGLQLAILRIDGFDVHGFNSLLRRVFSTIPIGRTGLAKSFK